MPRAPHPNDRSDWLWEEEECPEWHHWRNERNPRIRVFQSKEEACRWMVAVYEVRADGKGYATDHQEFDGEGAELRAFIAGEQMVHPLKTFPQSHEVADADEESLG